MLSSISFHARIIIVNTQFKELMRLLLGPCCKFLAIPGTVITVCAAVNDPISSKFTRSIRHLPQFAATEFVLRSTLLLPERFPSAFDQNQPVSHGIYSEDDVGQVCVDQTELIYYALFTGCQSGVLKLVVIDLTSVESLRGRILEAMLVKAR